VPSGGQAPICRLTARAPQPHSGHSPAARVPDLCVYECPHRQVRALRPPQPAWVPGRCRTSTDGDLARICCRITGTRLAPGRHGDQDHAPGPSARSSSCAAVACGQSHLLAPDRGYAGRRSAIFDPLTSRRRWLCRIGKCPGRTSWPTIGCMPLRGRSQRDWLFCGLSWSINTFEKTRLPVGTAGFEPATP
jgi:hypothetical protein